MIKSMAQKPQHDLNHEFCDPLHPWFVWCPLTAQTWLLNYIPLLKFFIRLVCRMELWILSLKCDVMTSSHCSKQKWMKPVHYVPLQKNKAQISHNWEMAISLGSSPHSDQVVEPHYRPPHYWVVQLGAQLRCQSWCITLFCILTKIPRYN